jgi:hypothetical protein
LWDIDKPNNKPAVFKHDGALLGAGFSKDESRAKLWYFDAHATIQVEADGMRWAVRQDKVREWLGRRAHSVA